MAKPKPRRKFTLEERRALLARVEAYSQQHGVRIFQALDALKIGHSEYYRHLAFLKAVSEASAQPERVQEVEEFPLALIPPKPTTPAKRAKPAQPERVQPADKELVNKFLDVVIRLLR